MKDYLKEDYESYLKGEISMKHLYAVHGSRKVRMFEGSYLYSNKLLIENIDKLRGLTNEEAISFIRDEIEKERQNRIKENGEGPFIGKEFFLKSKLINKRNYD